MNANAPVYIFDARDKPSLPLHDVPLIEATDESVKGYGRMVDDPEECPIEITRWPAQGWRPVDEGTGDEAKPGDVVEVHYTGKLKADGTVFDSSVKRGQAFKFPVGQGKVIKGWDETIVGMKPGELRTITIPSDMAYGERARGKIPANADLVFQVEMMRITPGAPPAPKKPAQAPAGGTAKPAGQ